MSKNQHVMDLAHILLISEGAIHDSGITVITINFGGFMKNIRQIALAVACACVAVPASAASFVSYGFTDMDDITGALTTGDMEFYASGLQTVIPGSFAYDFFFQVGIPYIGLGVVADLPSVGPKFNITGLKVDLYSDFGSVAMADAGDMMMFTLGTGDYITGGGTLGAGNYYFHVTGQAVGTLGGKFSYSASAVPVPEPETWAMLVAGLGLVGLQLRRRTNSSKISIN